VLTYGYYHRKVEPITFWRKRFGAVLWPYVLWSAGYEIISNWHTFTIGNYLYQTGLAIVLGTAWFHLYFLLVSMQFYLVFPLFKRLLVATKGHHGKLIATAAAIQVGAMLIVTYVPPPSNFWLNLVWARAEALLPMYILLVTVGAVFAAHYEEVRDWILGHVALVTSLALAGIVVGVGAYFIRVDRWDVPPYLASSSTSPWLLPNVAGVIALLYLATALWHRRHPDGSGAIGRFVAFGTVRAFGVFAMHPMVLWLLTMGPLGLIQRTLHNTVLEVLVTWAIAVAAALAVTEVLLRTPLSRYLVGQSRLAKAPIEKTAPSALRRA
jgi:hypothetical protein